MIPHRLILSKHCLYPLINGLNRVLSCSQDRTVFNILNLLLKFDKLQKQKSQRSFHKHCSFEIFKRNKSYSKLTILCCNLKSFLSEIRKLKSKFTSEQFKNQFKFLVKKIATQNENFYFYYVKFYIGFYHFLLMSYLGPTTRCHSEMLINKGITIKVRIPLSPPVGEPK